MPTNKKPFLLGVGCHKGGTSWLWNYLCHHPDCSFPPMKEMHVFDVYFKPERFGKFRKTRLNSIGQIIAETAEPERLQANHKIYHNMQLLLMSEDLRLYPLYLDKLQAEGVEKYKLVADITPSYCLLRAEHFNSIRALMAEHGYTTKVVFLMRDPIERVFSALRMFDRNNANIGIEPASERFNNQYADWRRRSRSDYKKIIEKLEASFPLEDIFYGFYETLFTESEIRRLTNFLDISYVPADFTRRINASPIDSILNESQIGLARNTYDWVYSFCADKFGQDFIRSIWKHY